MSDWIDVARTLPEQNQEVLITGFERCRGDVTEKRFWVIAVHLDGIFYNNDTGDDFYPPTHWMVLTEPT